MPISFQHNSHLDIYCPALLLWIQQRANLTWTMLARSLSGNHAMCCLPGFLASKCYALCWTTVAQLTTSTSLYAAWRLRLMAFLAWAVLRVLWSLFVQVSTTATLWRIGSSISNKFTGLPMKATTNDCSCTLTCVLRCVFTSKDPCSACNS